MLQSPLLPTQQLNEANDSNHDPTIAAKHQQIQMNKSVDAKTAHAKTMSSRGREERKRKGQDAINENENKNKNKNKKRSRDGQNASAVPVNPSRITFEERLVELAAFKAKHGHCNALCIRSSEYFSLGTWCSSMRGCYKQKQEGMTSGRQLSQDQIDRFEALGFE